MVPGVCQLEAEARTLYTYECRVIPGLLQTEAYARALFENSIRPLSDKQIETQLLDREDRQRLLRERPNTAFSFILRNVEVQVMSLQRSEHGGLDGPLHVLETPEHEWLACSGGQFYGETTSNAELVATMLHGQARMRTQALTPEDSLNLLTRLREELGER